MNDNVEFKRIKLSEIVPYEHNARTHSEEQVAELVESIKTLGLLNPLSVATRKDGKYDLIAGHGRLMALQKIEGVETVPAVIHHDLSDDEMLRRTAILADNEIATHAGYDPQELLFELTAISNEAPKLLSVSGFTNDDIMSLIPDVGIASEDEFGTGEKSFKVSKKMTSFVKRDDVFELEMSGDSKEYHRVICGDASEAVDLETLLDGEMVDLLITDPPYNVAIGQNKTNKGKDRDLKNDKFSDDLKYAEFLEQVYGVCRNVMKDSASFYIFYADVMAFPNLLALRNANLPYRQTLVWEKNAATLSWSDYQWKHEPLFYGEMDEAVAYHNEGEEIGYGFLKKTTRVWNKDHKQPTILEHERPKASKMHPTMKPITLLGYFMKNSSKPYMNVLDVFGGSGSTLICADELDRRCFMCELDEKYVATELLRFATHTRWENEILRDGEDVREQLRDWAVENNLPT